MYHKGIHYDKFARGKQHVNGIESFWSFVKRRLNKFNGIKKDKFEIHLKESEYRFNCRLGKKKIYEELLKLIKIHVKNENKKNKK